MRSTTSRTALAAVFVLALGCPQSEAPSRDAQRRGARGLVLITVDGLHGDELTLFGGSIATPALVRLASDGRAWRDGVSPCPMTRPAVATYLTGLAPDRHGVLDDAFDALPEAIPTLAELLARAGYRTAAFPDSSVLGADSGLLRGFELVDDPPAPASSSARRIPSLRDSASQIANVGAWLRAIGRDERFFLWIHSTLPLVRQMVIDEEASREQQRVPATVEEFDTRVGQFLALLDETAGPSDVAILVAGTLGDVSGGSDELPGPGMSLAPRALRVPVLARWPATVVSVREADAVVAAADVALTIAALGGVTLDGAEGTEVLAPAPPERELHAFTRAPLDQFGWPAEQAVLRGGVLRISGAAPRTLDWATAAVSGSPSGADLAARPTPAPRRLNLAQVRPLLEPRALALDPLPELGRVLDAEIRREAALRAWKARVWQFKDRPRLARQALARLAAVDPDNLAALLDQGNLATAVDGGVAGPESRRLLDRAAERYPTVPEAVHWHVHAHWSESWQSGEALLDALLAQRPGDPDLLYDLACTRSMSGDLARAEDYLRRAIRAGFHQWSHIETDPDLRRLREGGQFAVVMQEFGR